jgi:hypothetical protein
MNPQNIYKVKKSYIDRMFPSDPTGSLDEFFLILGEKC